MATRDDHVIGWIGTSINDFLNAIDEPAPSMAYVLITGLDSSPDVASAFRFLETRPDEPLELGYTPVGQGVLVDTGLLIAANRRHRIFFGFDEVWFFPTDQVAPKPADFHITRPGSIVPGELERHRDWVESNRCSLGLGDGEGMNYWLRVQDAAGLVVRALNESMTPASP